MAHVSCIPESGCCCLFIPLFLHFSFSNFQHWNFSSLFSGTVRSRILKIGTYMDSGQIYHVYQNQAAAAYSSLYSFFFLSSFQHWNFSSHFSQELWGLEDWNLVHEWTVGRHIVYTIIRLLLLYFFIFLFLLFSNLEIFCHFSRKLWGLQDWKLIHTWTVGRCIMYTRIRLLLLIDPFIPSFFFTILQFFITLFLGTVRPRRLKLNTHMDSGHMYHVFRNQAAASYSSRYSFIFLSPIFNIEIFRHFSREL